MFAAFRRESFEEHPKTGRSLAYDLIYRKESYLIGDVLPTLAKSTLLSLETGVFFG